MTTVAVDVVVGRVRLLLPTPLDEHGRHDAWADVAGAVRLLIAGWPVYGWDYPDLSQIPWLYNCSVITFS